MFCTSIGIYFLVQIRKILEHCAAAAIALADEARQIRSSFIHIFTGIGTVAIDFPLNDKVLSMSPSTRGGTPCDDGVEASLHRDKENSSSDKRQRLSVLY